MDDYALVIFLLVVAALCWMAGVVKVVLVLVALGAAVSLAAVNPKMDLTSDNLLWTASAYLFSRSGSADSRARPFDPVLDLDPVSLLQYWGYPGERHYVTTDDGHVLGLHRIAGPRGSGPQHLGVDAAAAANKLDVADKTFRVNSRRPAVILAHSLLSSSADWIVTGPGKALGLLLADEGYDVWLFNARGNTYSLNHTTLNIKDEAYWEFSFHEHAILDMPATIQHVVRETGQQQVQYVGFSMGATIMCIMASERPDMAKHISLFTALGPATALAHSRSRTFHFMANISPVLQRIAKTLRVRRFLPSTPAIAAAGEIFCSDGSLTQPLCSGIINSLSGRNDAQHNTTLLPYVISKTPGGTSFMNIDHFSQSMKLGFQRYDYGKAGNLKHYALAKPPKYNLSKVFVPTRVHYGMNDFLVDWRDVRALCSRLPILLSCDSVSDPLWTHLDFAWGKDADALVYRKVMTDMSEFARSRDSYASRERSAGQ